MTARVGTGNLRRSRHLNGVSSRTAAACSLATVAVAGPRESKEPGVYEWTLTLVRLFLNRAR
jgi:hypothetical protein